MASKRRRSSEAAEPAKKRARFDVPSTNDGLPLHHEAEISSSSDVEDETLIHASPARAASSSDHLTSNEDDAELIHDGDEVALPSNRSSSSFSNEETPEDELTRRIRAAIAYTTTRLAAGLGVEVVTQFRVPFSPPHPALALLRPLSNEAGIGGTGLAHFVYADAVEEVYELGMPGPVQQDGVDPRWFHGQSRAEMRAGPFAEPADVRAAAGILRGMDTRAANVARANGGRTNRQAAIDDKLAEGLRRQEAGERMHGSSSEDDQISGRSGDSDDHGDNVSAPGPSSTYSHCDNETPAPRPRAVRFTIDSSTDSSNQTSAPRPRARPVIESSSESSNEAPAPRPRARPVIESSSESSNEAPASRPRARPIADSGSDSSDEAPAPRPRSARPVIESSSLDSDEESHVARSRQVATANVSNNSDSEEALHDEVEIESESDEASASSSRNDKSESDSTHEVAPEADDEEDLAEIFYDEDSEDESRTGSSDDNEPEADSSPGKAPEGNGSSSEESDPEPVDDETDGDEYVDGSSEEESQDEVVVPRRGGRVRVQRKP